MTPVEKHYRENRNKFVKKFTRTFGKAEAEDIIQDTYLKILEAQNDNIIDFDSYFSASLNSVITDHYRDIKMKGMVVELKESLPSSATPERDMIEKEMSSELTERIFNKTRHPLHYKVYSGYLE